jgi:hypothetical protein
MSKLVRVSGTAIVDFVQTIEVDDDFDPELHEPDIDFEDIVDFTGATIDFDAVEPWSEEQEKASLLESTT